VILLVVLGVLFSIPIVSKTFSAHGAIPALVTAFIVVALVFLGPIAFVAGRVIEVDVFGAAAVATDFEILLISSFGLALLLAWLMLSRRGPGYSFPYLPVTGWALVGAQFCVWQIFVHIL